MSDGQDQITNMVRDPDFAKLPLSEQRKALSAHDPMFQQAGDDAIGQFVQTHQSPGAGPNDPAGNYDFGGLGSVKGARMNGRPATRQEAFQQLQSQRGVAQTMGDTLQRNQQAVSNLGQSAFNTDQSTKEYMGDLAAMGVAGGASKLANAMKWGGTVLPDQLAANISRGAPSLAKKFVLGNTVGRIPGASLLGEQFERPTLKDVMGLIRSGSQGGALEQAASDPVQAAMQQRPMPGPQSPILTPLDAAASREAGSQAQVPATFGSSTLSPSARAPRAQGQVPPSVDKLLNNVMDALNKKYPQSKAQRAATMTGSTPAPQDVVTLLRQSIAAAQAK